MARGLSALTFSSRLAAVDFCDTHVVAAEGRRTDRGLEIHRLGLAALPPRADAAVCADTLRRLWRQTRMSCHNVATCFRGGGLMLKHFSYPSLSKRQVASALRLEAEEALQVAPDQIRADWHVANLGQAERNEATEGVMAAASAEELEAYLQILRAASLNPVVVDVGCSALANTYREVGSPGEAPGTATALLHLAGRRADIALLYGQGRLYPRAIFSHSVNWASVPDALAEYLKEALMYYDSKLKEQPASRIMVSGVLPDWPDLRNTLSEQIKQPIERWNPLDHVTLHGQAARAAATWGEASGAATACVGLTVRTY